MTRTTITARTDGQCHKCPADAEVKAGKFSDKAFEKTPCFKCRKVTFGQFPHRGRTVVSFDAAPPCETATRDGCDPAEGVDLSLFVDFIREIMRLPSETRDVVALRLLDLHGDRCTYRMIADQMGVTVQAVESRHRSAIRRIPALAAMFQGKEAKRMRRAGLN